MIFCDRKLFLAITVVAAFAITPVLAKPGKGNGGSDSDPPEQTSCAAYESEFPAFAYTQVRFSRRGSIEGHDIYVSNWDGSCSVLLVSLPGVSSQSLDLKYRQAGSTGLVVWRQSTDETVPTRKNAHRHDVIRLVRFEVQNKEVINSEVHTVKNSGTGDIEYNSLDLSSDGDSILVYKVSPNVDDVYISSIHEMDITNCSSDCPMIELHQDDADKVLLDISYNDAEDRVYFSGYYKFLDALGDLAGQGFISFIENADGQWSDPKLVTVENNGFYSTPGESYYAFPTIDVADVNLGGGVTEAIAHTFADTNTNPPSVHLVDTGACEAGGALDCISSGESHIEFTIADAEHASFGEDSVYFSSTINQQIYRYDLASGALEIVGVGNESDATR